MKNSSLELESNQVLSESTIVAGTESTPKVQLTKQNVTETNEKPKPPSSNLNKSNPPVSTVPSRPATLETPKGAPAGADLFVSPSKFPSWDD